MATDDAIKTGFESTTTAPSTAQTFKVSAVGLTDDLVITQDFPTPILYELSKDGTSFSDTLKFSPITGEIAEKTVYVRYKSQPTPSAASTKNLVLSSTNHNKTYISCTGLVSNGTGIKQITPNLDVKLIDGKLQLSNLNRGELISIYNQLGQKIYSALATDETHICVLKANGIMFIQAGNLKAKIRM